MGSCEHPYHAGDMPPLFGNHGYAFVIFLTDRFCVEELLRRTVIVNLHPDDFRSQLAGNSGMKIACGVIRDFRVDNRYMNGDKKWKRWEHIIKIKMKSIVTLRK